MLMTQFVLLCVSYTTVHIQQENHLVMPLMILSDDLLCPQLRSKLFVLVAKAIWPRTAT